MHQLNPLHYHQIIHQFRVLLAAIRLVPVVHRLANTSDEAQLGHQRDGGGPVRCRGRQAGFAPGNGILFHT
jgi:hypothetical protein